MKNKNFLKAVLIFNALFGISGWFGYTELTKSEISGSISPTDKKVVIFDFDGVICDSFNQFIQVFNEVAPYYNLLKVANSDLADLHNYETERVFKKHGLSAWKTPIVVYHLRHKLKQLIPTLKLHHGVKETIKELMNKGIVVGIATSNSQENVQAFLKNNNLDGFQFIFTGSSMFGKAKNLKLIKEQLGSKSIFYVGDEVRDVEAAKEAGVYAIAVTWGFHSKKLLETSRPFFIANTPSELLEIVK